MSNLTAIQVLHMNDVIEKCGCSCHDAASDEMHMTSCCEYTYQKTYREDCAICGNTLTDDKDATWHYSTNHNACDICIADYKEAERRITPSQYVDSDSFNLFEDRSDKSLIDQLNITTFYMHMNSIQFMEYPTTLHFENSRRYEISANSYKHAADSEFQLHEFAYFYSINYSGNDIIVRGVLKKDIDNLVN